VISLFAFLFFILSVFTANYNRFFPVFANFHFLFIFYAKFIARTFFGDETFRRLRTATSIF